MGGWIKLHRKITESSIWSFDNPKYTLAFIDLLLIASYKESEMLIDGKIISVKRGQVITSKLGLSKRWMVNPRTVTNILNTLQDAHVLTYKCTNKYTTVFISKYAEYQDFSDDDCTTEYTTEYTTDCTTEYTHYKKDKKDKKDKKGFSLVEQHDYDFEDLERKLLKSEG